MDTYTIAEAAEVTGMTKKALRNRVDRGQVRAVLRSGVRRIPRSELARAGLLDGAAGRQQPHEAASSASADVAVVVRELVDRLDRQATELAELRLLTTRAESVEADRARLEQALMEARARIQELEAIRARRWFSRRLKPA